MGDEPKLDETIPGGCYIGVDGKPHDANGLPLDETTRAQAEAKPSAAPIEPRPHDRRVLKAVRFIKARRIRPGTYAPG